MPSKIYRYFEGCIQRNDGIALNNKISSILKFVYSQLSHIDEKGYKIRHMQNNLPTSASPVTSLSKSLDILNRSFTTILVNCLKIAFSFGIMLSRIPLQSTISKPLVVQNDIANLFISSIHAFIWANCFC